MDRIRRHLARYGEWWWVPVLYTLAVIWIYRDLYHQHGTATGLGWDVIDTHGPDLDFFSREIREDRFSLWNPYDKGGYPVYADPIFDRYYPLNWPFGWFGAAFGTGFWLVQVKVLAHHVIGASLLHLYLRSRKISAGGAIIGGLGLLASTPLLIHKGSNILWPMVWVPLVWLAIDACLAKPSWRRGAGLGAVLLLCETAGSPPGLFYTLLLVGPYGLYRLVALAPRRREVNWGQLAICLAVAAAIAGLVLAIVVLPERQLVALGSRERWAKGDDFALSLSAPWREVIRGVIARGAGLQEMYMGSAVMLLAACAVFARPRYDRGIAILWIVIAALGVALASGATGEVLPWFVHHVPGFALLRIPGRYKLISIWALAAAAGYGADAVGARWRSIGCGVALLALVIYLVNEHGQPASPIARVAWWSIAAMAIAAGLVAIATLLPARWRGLALGAIAIGTLLDAPTFLFLDTSLPVSDPRREHELDATVLPKLDGVRDRFRVYDEFLLGERVGARQRVRDFRGYPAVDPLSQNRYVEVLEMARKDARILADFNVRYVLYGYHFRFAQTASFVRMPSLGFHDLGSGIFEADHPAPLIQWYGSVAVVRDPDKVLAAVRGAERQHAVVELDMAKKLPFDLALESELAVPGTLVDYQADAIETAVDAPKPGLVVLDELWYPGWTVEVDGEPAELLRANYIMRAVWVGAGHHEIVWRFEPAGFRPLLAGYVLALGAIGAAGVCGWRRRRRSPVATAPQPEPEHEPDSDER